MISPWDTVGKDVELTHSSYRPQKYEPLVPPPVDAGHSSVNMNIVCSIIKGSSSSRLHLNVALCLVTVNAQTHAKTSVVFLKTEVCNQPGWVLVCFCSRSRFQSTISSQCASHAGLQMSYTWCTDWPQLPSAGSQLLDEDIEYVCGRCRNRIPASGSQ